MRDSNPHTPTAVRAAASTLVLVLCGCSSMQGLLSGDKLDYRSQATKTNSLEIPPDLTQLSRDPRYQPQTGTVSATAYQSSGAAGNLAIPAATAPVAAVAPQELGDMRIERAGNQRWLVAAMSPEQLWPQVRSFWEERGFTIAFESAEAGVLETDWAENRAKLPNDFIRNTIGRVLESLYSTGERDKFRTRIERTPTGSEVYISHRGLEEVFVGAQKDQTIWTGRPSDPSLEAEFLTRLMVKLGAKEEAARTAVATPTQLPARARVLDGQPGAALQVDEPFDRAWRRVGVALDRGGFTVEDRDRNNGVYFVRYIDPKEAAKEQPGFFKRLFGGGKDADAANRPNRYRIAVKSDASSNTTVSVQNSQGTPEGGEIGQRIVALLVEDLK